MYKLAVLGKRENVLGFMALGFSVFPVTGAEDGEKILRDLIKSENYAVILLTEDVAPLLEDVVAAHKDNPLPAITSIPCPGGEKGYGLANIRASVERAIGTDILFKEN